MEKRADDSYVEARFDGIVGGTYFYGGLSAGNEASSANVGKVSNPREAALQALEKARLVRDLTGAPQFILPPHERPFLPLLRNLGFSGDDAKVIADVRRDAPHLLASASSSSAMWAANAATVAPSVDTKDGRIHIVPASLGEMLHRSLEGPVTERILRAVFPESIATVHEPLHLHPRLGDEGAANHMRFADNHGDRGTHLFVYGQDPSQPGTPKPGKYPARQTFDASRALARLNQLDPARVIFAQQNPAAIDAGIFHNDVISVNDRGVWLLHEGAYLDTEAVIAQVRATLGGELTVLMATADDLPYPDVVSSYVFNSDLVDKVEGGMAVIAPVESEENPYARAFLERVLDDPGNSVEDVRYVNVRESMNNGGGPACLRLRTVMSPVEVAAVQGNCRVMLDDALHGDLVRWVNQHYRDRMLANDLADPGLLLEQKTALDELTQIMGLGGRIYDFQRDA